MKKFLTLFYILFITISSNGPSWPLKFQQDFTEKMNYLITSGTTKGKIYYDFKNLKYRLDREDGKYDHYCGTIFRFISTPCSHYVLGSKRYIHFPEKKYCCTCCDSKHGCGVLNPNWMKDGEKIEEYEKDGKKYQVWKKGGLQWNTMTVVKIGNSWVLSQIDQKPNDLIDFIPESQGFDFDDSVFDMPEECGVGERCSRFSFCGIIQGSEI